MRKCELCDSSAKMYCESDQASLCWDCDAEVHGANFLVAKHSRTLLCHLCQSLTPWTGSGPKLSPTVSVCPSCVNNSHGEQQRSNEDDGDDGDNNNDEEDDTIDREDDTENDGDDQDDDGRDGGDQDDDENQVVPWSPPPPPPVSSTSHFEGRSSGFCNQ